MSAVACAAMVGLCTATRSPLGWVFGAWAILAVAAFALFSPNIDLAAWAQNLGLAIVGYNAGLLARVSASALPWARRGV